MDSPHCDSERSGLSCPALSDASDPNAKSPPSDPSDPTEPPTQARPGWRGRLGGVAGWILCAVPLVGVFEFALHVKQTGHDIVPESDWVSARELVMKELGPDDVVVFSPFWTDPIGRQTFGDTVTMARAGRSDDRRFRRAFELSIRDAHDESLARWKKVKEQNAGRITIVLYENPDYTRVIDDTLRLATPDRLTVSRVDASGEQPCPFLRGASAGGSTVVPQGLLTPADKFVCQGGHVGIAVLHALDHHPHVCLYATPMQGATLRLRFSNVTFGSALYGHSGIQWMVERTPAPEKVAVVFSAFDRPIGTHFHKVGAGWVGFELPTPDLDQKRGELVADILPSGQRQFCFEATTRRVENPQ